MSVRYLLDTNIVIFALRTRAEALRARFAAATDQMAVSTITVAELAYGVERSSRPDQNRGAVEEFLAPVSYTHLDVYKRQPLRIALRRNWATLSHG